MRNLFIFIVKNHFFLLFLLLEAISVALIVQYNEKQGARFNATSNVVFSNLYSATDGVSQYFNLQNVNGQLAAENAYLRKQITDSKFSNGIDLNEKSDSLLEQQYTYITAKVLNNTIHTPQNFITLNKGRRHGVYKDMAVISPQGVVGIVQYSSENFSRVISMLNTQYHVSAKFEKNSYFGSVYWDGKSYDEALLTEIPYHVNVKEGDMVVTNSYSNMYPGNIPVGHVASFVKSENDNFYTIRLKLATDFKNIDYVYVVQDLYKTEREYLEEEID